MDNCKEKIDLGHYWDLKGLRIPTVGGEPFGYFTTVAEDLNSELNQEQIQLKWSGWEFNSGPAD